MTEDFADPDRVFAALADARRRELLELLAREPDASAGGLAAELLVSRQAVAQHLAVLEEARLVTRRRAGRQVLFTVRPEGLTATAEWLAARAAAWRSSSGGGPAYPLYPSDSLLTRRKIHYCDGMSVVWNRYRRGTLDS
jgi:DNA-binding transcriptional ArsR family regulator